MSNDFETLHDALLEIRMDWEAVERQYEQSLASHLRSCVAPGGLSLGALAGVAADLGRFYTGLEQLRACAQRLDDVLIAADEVRVLRYSPQPPTAGGPASAPDVGEARTSTREPSSEGCTQPESGQRKWADPHQYD